MTPCAVCAKNVEPVTALHDVYGICEQCPTCQTPFVQVQGGTYLTRPDPNEKREPAPELPAARPIVAPVQAPTVSAATTTDVIVAHLRTRLAAVEKEIAARLGFEVERDRLKRMLAAAGDESPVVNLAN